jgi:hypothetical protein
MRSTPPAILGAVEGAVDESVLQRLIAEAGGLLAAVYGKEGKGALRKDIRGYNNSARSFPWVVLIDLDRDAACVPSFLAEWLPKPAPLMRFRVAVRAIEAWLLADRRSMAAFLRVPLNRIPDDTDALPDPKRYLVDLARHSRRAGIRQDMVPRDGSGRSVGPAYASRLAEFADQMWRPDEAAQHSDSLRRCRQRIAELVVKA